MVRGLGGWAFCVAAMGLLASCSGCGSAQQEKASERPSALSRTNEIIVALQSDGTSLDPHTVNDAASMRLIENMYDTLFRYTETYGAFAPALVSVWTLAEDQRTYRLTLKTNATFHASGRTVTAEDVKYSLERMMNIGARSFQLEGVHAMRVLDPFIIEIELDEPFAPFPIYLAHPMNAIVDREVVEATGLDRTDGGSGPFRLVEWKKDRHLILEKYDAYAEPNTPILDRVIYRPIPDETARTIALRNGEVDIILDVAAKDVALLEAVPGIRVTSVPGTFWEYLGLNCTRAPLSDPRVRQAIAWAVDRSLLNRLVKFGRATELTGGPIPPNHWAYAELNLYPRRDVERAKHLLVEAGYPDGFPLTVKVGSAFAYQVRAAEVIKQQLRDIGIEVKIQALESGLFFHALGNKEFEAAIVGWLGFVDPDEWTYNLFKTDAPWNQQGYSNAQVDAWLEQGRSTLDSDVRKSIYKNVQRQVAMDAPMVFLYVNDRTSAMLDSVAGFEVHPTATTISLRNTRRERGGE